MGIYIKGIDMPKENEGVQLWIRNDGTVECVKSIFSKGDEPVATLIEMEQAKATYIPEPHGRLIDGDRLFDDEKLCDGVACRECQFLYKTENFLESCCKVEHMIYKSPTVIERSE